MCWLHSGGGYRRISGPDSRSVKKIRIIRYNYGQALAIDTKYGGVDSTARLCGIRQPLLLRPRSAEQVTEIKVTVAGSRTVELVTPETIGQWLRTEYEPLHGKLLSEINTEEVRQAVDAMPL